MTLSKWRKLEGISQREAAERMGVDQSVYCRWEKRQRAPTLANIATILRVTQSRVKLDDLERRGS